MPTRSPVRHGRTPGPTRSTTAATSCPGTRGSLSPGNAPPCTKRSLWQIPQARTRSSTCPAPGSGTSRVTSSSAAFAAGNRATVIVAMGMKVPRRRARAKRATAPDGPGPAGLPPFRRRLPRARGGALEQQLALPSVSGERCRALELVTRLVQAAELREQVAAHARQEVVALERRLRGQRIDQLEARRRTGRHGGGNRA